MRHDTLAIVVTWNKAALLERMLESLRASGPQDFDVLVVDNASTDGTLEMLREKYPDVAVLANAENLGGTGGFNSGMLEGLRLGYEYLWLNDNDIIVHPGAFRAMRDAMDADGRVAIVGAHVLYMEEPARTQEIGGRIDWETGELIQLDKDAVSPSSRVNECDYVSACCLLARAAAVRQVGIWDPGFFITFDDVEWCARMKERGWRIVAASEGRVEHASFFARRPLQGLVSCYYSVRNGLYFHRRRNSAMRRARLMYHLLRRLVADAHLFREGPRRAYGQALSLAVEHYLDGTMGKCPAEIDFAEAATPRAFPRLRNGARVLLIGSVSPEWIEAQRAAILSRAPGARVDVFVPSHARELVAKRIPGVVVVPFESFAQRIQWLVKSMGRYEAVCGSTFLPAFLFEHFAPWSIRLSDTGEPATIERGGVGAVLRKMAVRARFAIGAVPLAMRAAFRSMPPQRVFPFDDPPTVKRAGATQRKRRGRGVAGLAKAAANLAIAFATTAVLAPVLGVAWRITRGAPKKSRKAKRAAATLPERAEVRASMITVLVPALDAGATIDACLESIFADPIPAGFTEREVIVVDNGSSDDTAERARRAGATVLHCATRGQGPARNMGFRHARGEFILCTDSDCTVDPGWAGAMMRGFEDPRVAVVGGEIVTGRFETAAERHAAARRLLSQEDAMRGFPGFYLPFAITANAAFRRAALNQVGHFDETIHPAEDADLSWRMQIAGWRLKHAPDSRVKHFHRATALRYWRQIYGYGFATAGLFAKYSDRMGRCVWLGLDSSGDIRRSIGRAVISLPSRKKRELALLDLATQTAALAGRIVGSIKHRIVIL